MLELHLCIRKKNNETKTGGGDIAQSAVIKYRNYGADEIYF